MIRSFSLKAGRAWSPSIVGQAMSCKWSKGTSRSAGDEHHNLVCAPFHKAPENRASSQYGEIAGALTKRHDSSPCADRGMTIIASHGSPLSDASDSITRPGGRECKPGATSLSIPIASEDLPHPGRRQWLLRKTSLEKSAPPMYAES